jgi:tetratricopeptide (TPR) repeat protein
MIVGTLLLVFNGRRLLNRYDNWRAGHVAEEASALMENQRWEAASLLIQTAIRRSPNQPAVLRVTAELFMRAYDDPQSAIAFQRKLLSSGQATPADQRRLGEILLQMGDTSAAKRLYDELPSAEKDSRKGMELQAGVLRAQGQAEEAIRVLRQAWQRPPQDTESRLRLAMLDESQAFDSAKSQAGRVIWDIARLDDVAALTAISHLCKTSTLTPPQADELQGIVEKHPRTNDNVRYTMLRTYLRLHPLERDRVIAAEEARNAGRPADEKFEFLRWLGLEGEHERILRILPQQSIHKDADLFLLYVDALSAAGQWAPLLKLVQTGKPPITQPTAHVIQAQCYAQLKPDQVDARHHIRRAYDLSGRGESTIILRAAGVAAQHHHNDLAVEGYRVVATARPAQRLRLLEKIVELQRLDQDVTGMMTTLQELRTLRPGSQSYADQLNYLRLVSGLGMETAYEEVLGFQQPSQASAAPSATLPPALLRALAAYRFGRDDAMRHALESLPDPTRLAPGPRAVVSCLYAFSGREVEGFRLAEKISPLSLLESEAPFLKRSLK